jgi:AcrR family transcriptional regulator
MYHHFDGKADLAAVAIARSAATFREGAEQWLANPGTSLERIRGYLLRSRDVLKGCQIGRLCQDPEIVSESRLSQPLARTFEWLQLRLQGITVYSWRLSLLGSARASQTRRRKLRV